MPRAVRYLGQALIYAVIAVLLGYFASAPSYQHFPGDTAEVKISIVHGAKPKGECRRLSAEELAKLAPNMRQPLVCPRERLPVTVELDVDGKMLVDATLPPTGLSGDGPSRLYRVIPVTPGRHHVVARLRDSSRTTGFDYEREAEIEIEPARIFVIDFKADAGGFVFGGQAEQ
jgi:hypothetical protein